MNAEKPVLTLKLLWTNGSYILSVLYPDVSLERKSKINDIADGLEYRRSGNIWSPPETGSQLAALRAGLALEGVDLNWKDGPFSLQRLNLQQDTRKKLEGLENFELEHLSGWTPVQAEGKLDSQYFYFRARGAHWRFELGGNESGSRSALWWHEEYWPTDTGFGAGYLTDEEAIGCILRAIDVYRTEDRGRFEVGHADYE